MIEFYQSLFLPQIRAQGWALVFSYYMVMDPKCEGVIAKIFLVIVKYDYEYKSVSEL